MTSEWPDRSLRALVLAPRGRDAAVACALIRQTGVECVPCSSLSAVVDVLDDDVAFLLITEEAIRGADLRPLSDWLGKQPPWSDMPFLLVTDHGGGPERNPIASRWLETLGNVSFIERPFHPTTLLSVARAAVKGRRRQHDTRRLLANLWESDQRLRTALHAGRLAAWEFDFPSSRLTVAAEGKTILGLPLMEDVGLDWLMRGMLVDDHASVRKALGHSVASGRDFAADVRFRRPDDRIVWLDVRARLVRDARGAPRRFVGLASDITTRKLAEETLQDLNEQLEKRVQERTAQLRSAHDELVAQIAERERTEAQLRQMQKLESIGQLTGGVAHDFNNLLTAVIGNLELLRKRVPSHPASDRLIDGAMQGAQRGAALTQRLLAFARHQALDVRPVDLAGLIRGMDDLLRRSLGPSVTMLQDLPRGIPPAHVDANQLELALLNLVVNSRDAMPEGGTVTLSLDVAETGAARDLAAGRYVRVIVADTGSGMDAETLRKAIEPFFSTKDVGKGTGLGLSMIHGLAQQLKGTLRLYSTPGRGTRAELWLPVAEGAAEVLPQPGADAASEARKAARLLFVDDDFLISLSTTSLLEDLGHTVVTASSGAEALEVLRTGEPIDMMITDYAMPGMTGLQLAEEARALRPGLPILLATGYADLPTKSRFELPRLNKPYQQMQLAEQIQGLLG
ncbi:hybrid sensor histidine kinase/response regulator [Reyranella aquatilis]|uniref:hybrid sensor histidine kinase/response regulator n=1 Tax=Reyranella aquatilis TaxID=2035356 RepID=UPI001E5F6532|nr:PAS domain-containing sensor histidine kinase [Reyranella aquatilis]